MAKTLLDTPEIEWRYVYGVMWDADAEAPYVEYATLKEAKAVAAFIDGYIVARKIFATDWFPVAVEELENAERLRGAGGHGEGDAVPPYQSQGGADAVRGY